MILLAATAIGCALVGLGYLLRMLEVRLERRRFVVSAITIAGEIIDDRQLAESVRRELQRRRGESWG